MPKVIFALILILFSIPFLSAPSAASSSIAQDIIIINEMAWMGTKTSASDEWIELYNESDQNVSIEGWKLKTLDGGIEIKLKGSVSSLGYFLLERTDDNTLPTIKADQIYKGALGNNGEKLELYNNLGNLIDSADYTLKWPAGDNKTKQTMERKINGDPVSAVWQTSENPEGTPNAKNSFGVKIAEQKTSNLSVIPQGAGEPKTEESEMSAIENISQDETKKENPGLAMVSNAPTEKSLKNIFMALIIAILSTTAITILNKEINKDKFA
ncbi:hypothetical protein BWK69_00765 [Candidatus Parcubacteria bacterium A4]|nr:MAG: hypothetical protein BWK69_00765 [Candidatus Parcubacteria bacterium A4]